MEDYRTIRGTAIGEYEEKKSRFIAQLSFADSEEKAVAFLEQVRAANRTARHNVYAYRLRQVCPLIEAVVHRHIQRHHAAHRHHLQGGGRQAGRTGVHR